MIVSCPYCLASERRENSNFLFRASDGNKGISLIVILFFERGMIRKKGCPMKRFRQWHEETQRTDSPGDGASRGN